MWTRSANALHRRRLVGVRTLSAAFVLTLFLGSVAGCSSGTNAGILAVTVTGLVTNAAGTCVATHDSGPYIHKGVLCAGERLGRKGHCVTFTASNANAASSSLPSISDVRTVSASDCRK